MTIHNTEAVAELKEVILSTVKEARNLTPSEIVNRIHQIFPHYTNYEVKYLVKEMQANNELVHDIIYGGLRVA